MTVSSCVFCAIIRNDIPATRIYENNHIVVIKDIAPKAPVHLLIIPKIHITDIASLQEQQTDYAIAALLVTTKLQKQLSGAQAFRLITNTGTDAGQSVFHLHFHFLSGKHMTEL